MNQRVPILSKYLNRGPAGEEVSLLGIIEVQVRLDKARRHIDEHYAEPLDLHQLARIACFSRYHFLRLFRTVYGITPHRYLMQRRVAVAKEMLIINKFNVTEVCYEVGFESLGSFSLLFKRLTGKPPLAYRAGLFRPVPPALIWPRILVPFCLIEKLMAREQNRNFREAATAGEDYVPGANSGGTSNDQ